MDTPLNLPLCRRIASRHPYPLLFATVSGAHLYGFPSPDSDYDLRGVHLLPAREVLGLRPTRDTIESAGVEEGVEIDLVTHDAAKFFRLLLRRNGYVLEQLFSPLVVVTTPEHEELKSIARDCITRHHVHHYLGFLRTQWGLFEKGPAAENGPTPNPSLSGRGVENPPRSVGPPIKPLLYVYRVILTGIHLMRTGEVEANLPVLHGHYGRELALDFIPDLIACKVHGQEKGVMAAADLDFHRDQKERLELALKQAGDASTLPEMPAGAAALSDLLVRLRTAC